MSARINLPEQNTPIIEVIDVWRTYRAGTHQEVHALQGITITVDKPSYVTVRGRSGSGKTTLLNCIGGLDKPTKGDIRVFGNDLLSMSDSSLTKFRRKQVGFIFQSFGLNPTFSAYENVDIMLRIGGLTGKECRERTIACLEMVGLMKWRNHRPDELSGGQQQRIAIARALANRPRLILADEPTGDLDSITARDILGLFRKIVNDEHVTLLISSHDPMVNLFSDKVFELSDGKLV